jgi:hypothetical protein
MTFHQRKRKFISARFTPHLVDDIRVQHIKDITTFVLTIRTQHDKHRFHAQKIGFIFLMSHGEYLRTKYDLLSYVRDLIASFTLRRPFFYVNSIQGLFG